MFIPDEICFVPRASCYLVEVDVHFQRLEKAELFRRELDLALARILEHSRASHADGEYVAEFETLACKLYYQLPPLDGRVVISAVFFPLPLPPEEGALANPAGVPRRFGLGAVLAFTLASALLFAALKAMRVEPYKIGLIALFFLLLGVGQVCLFGGKQPRQASMLVGAVYAFCVSMVLLVLDPRGFDMLPILIQSAFIAVTFGIIAGYGCGGLLATMFLWRSREKD